MKEQEKAQPTLARLEIEKIAASKTNKLFRTAHEYTAEALAELMDSIRVHDVIQPITVRPDGGDGFELISGERRYQACLLLGMESIPAYIIEADDQAALEMQIIENLQRKDVNPIQEAQGFAQLIDRHRLAAAEIARRIGKSPDYVQERVRLTRLIPEIQELVRSGEIPLKAGLKMARIPEELQADALESVTETMHVDQDKGKTRKVTVFRGLEELQEFMDSRLWCDLSKADFDQEDPTLVPENGKCSTCQHRTRNTGGLFDDITNGEKCLLAACFRAKQVETYRRTAEQIKAKHPGREVIFREREVHVEGREIFKKELGELFTPAKGEEISEKEFKSDPEAFAAVLVGIPRWTKSTKRIAYLKTKERPEQRQAKRPVADVLKNNRLRSIADRMTEARVYTEAIAKASTLDKLLEVLLEEAGDSWDKEQLAIAATALGFSIPYKIDGKKKLLTPSSSSVECMELDDNEKNATIEEEDIVAAVAGGSQAKKIAFILAAIWIDKQEEIVERVLKLNVKALEMKAGTQASEMVKQYKASKKPKEEPEPKKKGLASLLKKGGAKR